MLQRNNAFSFHSLIYLWQLKSCLKSQVYFRSILLDIADTHWSEKKAIIIAVTVCHKQTAPFTLFLAQEMLQEVYRHLQLHCFIISIPPSALLLPSLKSSAFFFAVVFSGTLQDQKQFQLRKIISFSKNLQKAMFLTGSLWSFKELWTLVCWWGNGFYPAHSVQLSHCIWSYK